MKEIIKTIIKDFHKRGIPELVKRNIELPINSGKIVSVIGVRRSGKTYLMYQTMQKINDITSIIYINFEDERLELTSKELNQIIESYFELYPAKKEKDLFFFFDEIQEVEGWEKFIRRMYDTVSKNIFITGSSSKLLSKEIASSLRGRTVSYEVYPLSFKEYCRFKNIEIDVHSTKGKAWLVSIFNEYMLKGGFPEIVNMKKEFYEKTLLNYFEVMVYRDIAERYNLTNILPLKLFIKRLVANTAQEFSINKIFNSFKSQGIKISKDTLYKFLDYCEDAYIILPMNNFSESINKQISKKAYSIDQGFSLMLSFALSKDLGRLLENIIFIEFKRRAQAVHYYMDKNECDFIIKEKDKITQAIQVCYELNENNQDRELKGLREAMTRFNLKTGILITYNQNREIGNIKVLPAYKWMLRGGKSSWHY